MKQFPRTALLVACLVVLAVSALSVDSARAESVLFDATRNEMAGDADWIFDADSWNRQLPAYPCSGTSLESNPGRFPTPPQEAITPSTPEIVWTGGVSAWAVDLVKAGHTVEQLPPGGRITFRDPGNPQDLSHYDVFIVVEPQVPFTEPERNAILDYVFNGGGLFMVANHETSDRDCDGWDSPHIWNRLTGATSPTSGGYFGIWFRVDGAGNQGSEDWFDDPVDANTSVDPSDPIIQGPFGSGAGGLGLFGATSMELDLGSNSSARGHVWRSGQPQNDSRVTFATARFGAGRVAAVGDSSPADDATGDPGDTLYPGWDKAAGGVANREIFLNATHWLIDPSADLEPPVISSGPVAEPLDCSATITWTTNEPATSTVEYGETEAYGSSASGSNLRTDHVLGLGSLAPSTPYHYRVLSADQAGNGPTASDDHTFTTLAAAAPEVLSGPLATDLTGVSATITWTTDEPATSEVRYGTTTAYGLTEARPGFVRGHTVKLSGLAPNTTYHYRTVSEDHCGNGPTLSDDGTFTTGPAVIDVSGWTIRQQNSERSWTLPEGSFIPAGGYLVVARDATRGEFEAYYPSMPAGTAFVNSDEDGSCGSTGCMPVINGDETFELYDATDRLVDGPTVPMSPTRRSFQRKSPSDPAGSADSWTVVDDTAATPGSGVGALRGVGVRINEFSDAGDFTKEFIELYYDAGAVDLSNWTIRQNNSTQSFTLPAGTTIPPGGYLVIARSATRSEFEAFYPGMPAATAFLNSNADGSCGTTGCLPVINGDETFELYDPSYLLVDGPTVAMSPTRRSFQRVNPGDPAASPSSWTSVDDTAAHPGAGAGTPTGVGLRINEFSDASDFTKEFLELYYDAAVPEPDNDPPSAVTDLGATALSSSSVRLTWTAVGDDGTSGTAQSYDLRRSDQRILTLADFEAATPLGGEPVPGPAGSPQEYVATELAPGTTHYFALRVSDEAGNRSELSNDAWATTDPAPVDVSGWTIRQQNSERSWTLPEGSFIPAGGYLVVARDATRGEFEAYYPSMPAGTTFANSDEDGACGSTGCMPVINGDETFELYDASDRLVDGPTVPMSPTRRSFQRKSPSDPAGSADSWTVVDDTAATPGSGVGALRGVGVRINEFSDAGDFTKEFIELYYDAGAIDLSNWTIRQNNSTQSFTLPAGTTIPPGGYLVIARDATRSEFEAFHPGLPPTAVFLDSNADGSCGTTGCIPLINGDETFELYDPSNVLVDGPTVPMSPTRRSFQRRNPGDPGGSTESWIVVDDVAATPGAGAGTRSGVGVRINEFSDAAEFPMEFVELFFDSAAVEPDDIAPSAVTDLAAVPLSSSSIRLTWTAVGGDGTDGTAYSYDLRRSDRRILTLADFEAATQLGGEPVPGPAGSPQEYLATELAPNTTHYFGLRVSDRAGNRSDLSNDAWGTTGPDLPPSATHLVVSQLQIAGTGDDVVEIYNPTASPVPLASGYSIQYLSAAGNLGFRADLNPGNSVPARGWYLVAGDGYVGPTTPDDSLRGSNMSSTAGHALLVAKNTNVTGCTDPAIVDKVGYGDAATCPEGGAGFNAATPGIGLAITRRPGGSAGSGQDTDVNAADFLPPATPLFHNRMSAPATPPSPLGNVGASLYASQSASITDLTWGHAAGATGYRVYRGTTPDFMGGSPSPWYTSVTNTAADATMPPSGAAFFYEVLATDGIDESED